MKAPDYVENDEETDHFEYDKDFLLEYTKMIQKMTEKHPFPIPYDEFVRERRQAYDEWVKSRTPEHAHSSKSQPQDDGAAVVDSADPFAEVTGGAVHRLGRAPEGTASVSTASSDIGTIENTGTSIRFEGVDGAPRDASDGARENAARASTERISSDPDDRGDTDEDITSRASFEAGSDELSETGSSSGEEDRDRDVDSDKENMQFG